MALPKNFNFAVAEPRIYEYWESSGCFRAGSNARPGAKPYCIVIPPPNVTGALHMGHALNSTLQDILVRWHRMRGFDTLWQPGVDHAGIATQMVVERELARTGEPARQEMGREAFLEKVWTWKNRYGGTIVEQFRRLGASCDWTRDRFTMDEGLSRAVREVFVRLFEEGLIYRDKRLVNWDPHFQTAISDLEVEQVETTGHLWHFRYPLEDGSGCIEVATTRPETMLGDTGVAVHPEDPRYTSLVGRYVRLPLVGRRIPVVADPHADPETGSGAVKITPAHDFNDFEVGRRTGLPSISVMDGTASMTLRGNANFLKDVAESDELEETLRLHGLDRFEARRLVVQRMEGYGLLERTEKHVHMVPHGDRSRAPIEPHLTDQWFVNASELARTALEAVRDGRTTFHPKQWEETYFQWLENIEPWCVSRQLWWGHRIPVWYGPDDKPFAALSERDAQAAALRHYGSAVKLKQDEDVLDTWFSSALWPFSTLGWPEQTTELKKYYPTGVLVTAFDIIFFWVARMMMAGLHFMKDGDGKGMVPFRDVYVHAIVRDESGRKMSKSLGNVLDPIALVEKFGADAVRFTLASMATQGRDIRLSTERIEGNRNFVSKLWNAARYSLLNECVPGPDFVPAAVKQPVNRWIVYKFARLRGDVDDSLAEYRFDDAARALHSTIWGVFCDWYIEFSKQLLSDEAGRNTQAETRATLGWALNQILIFLHPFMPFVTEELWHISGQHGAPRMTPLIHADWPQEDGFQSAPHPASAEVDWIVILIEQIRSVRSELGVPAAVRVPLTIVPYEEGVESWMSRHAANVRRLARIDALEFARRQPHGTTGIELQGAIACLHLAEIIDVTAERSRLEKRFTKIGVDIAGLEKKLSNPEFVNKAPEHVVNTSRTRHSNLQQEERRVQASLDRLSAISTEE